MKDYTRPFPGVIRVEPASACNLSCSHCPTGTVDMARGAMRPDTFKRVIEALTPHKRELRVVVLYHGGEPLLNKKFPEMVRAVKVLGVPYVKTVSNGMLMRDGWAEAIIVSGLDAIEFSIDGLSPAENNAVRRDGDYDTIVRNVKAFLAARKRMGSATPLVYISNTQFLAGPPVTDPQPPKFLTAAFKDEDIEEFKCTWAMRWPHMVVEERYDVWGDPDDEDTRNACDHVDSTMTIRWNGDVVACCYDLTSQLVLGNVLRESLDVIWNGPRYLALRKSIDQRKFPEPCINCNVVRTGMYLRPRVKRIEFVR
jgi:radical SAM protein with 4Fe4S-binding SPASM domain